LRKVCGLTIGLAMMGVSAEVAAQRLPDHGMEWRTVGSPGNAPLVDRPGIFLEGPIGAVDYEFRMARTEVTNAQYLEFLVALTSAVPSLPVTSEALGPDIYRVTRPGGYEWGIDPGEEQVGARMGFNYAAMYCNWLHNDKGTEPSAFLTGAYDASTFYPNAGPQQMVHSPGARFWLPSRDEWTKAMYFDPNKDGPGRAGYWLYPITSDVPPVGGPPGTPGAQTSAGDYDPEDFREYPVGSYPSTQSPWGILDGSGGAKEWCEGFVSDTFREIRGTSVTSDLLEWSDRVDQEAWLEFRTPAAGIRIVGIVPAPSSFIVMLVVSSAAMGQRRRISGRS